MLGCISKSWNKEKGVNKEQSVAHLQSIVIAETIEEYSYVYNLKKISKIW